MTGKKQEDTAFITAGDIGAVTKLSSAITGDTLCDPKRVVSFARMNFPEACLSMAVKVKNKGDEGKVAQGMVRLMEEDPTIKFEQNAETHQQVISGLGEQHIDVIVSKLKTKFGVDIDLTKPRVPYRETIRKAVKVQGKHKKQSGGHGQYGDVWVEFSPYDGEDLLFEENVFGGSVPRNFFPAVEKGLQDWRQARRARRIPGGRPEGGPRRRLLPSGRLVRNGVQDRRVPRLQGGHGAGFPRAARADRQPQGLRPRLQHGRHDQRAQQTPRPRARHEPGGTTASR